MTKFYDIKRHTILFHLTICIVKKRVNKETNHRIMDHRDNLILLMVYQYHLGVILYKYIKIKLGTNASLFQETVNCFNCSDGSLHGGLNPAVR